MMSPDGDIDDLGDRHIRRLDWSAARNLADLSELTARYLLGEADESVTYGGPPNEETAQILDQLVTLNRNGLLTTSSQPGTAGHHGKQRAYLDAFTDQETVARLTTACASAGLEMLTLAPEHRPEQESDFSRLIPVTASPDGRDFSWVGAWQSERELWNLWTWKCHPDAANAVLDAYDVQIFDPQWGRTALLWDTLVAALAPTSELAASVGSPAATWP